MAAAPFIVIAVETPGQFDDASQGRSKYHGRHGLWFNSFGMTFALVVCGA